MILHEPTKAGHGKIYVRVAEGLPELVRIPREKIRDRAELIHAVRYVSSQSDAIHSSAGLPKVFAVRAGVRIAGLILIFAALAVSCEGTPEGDQSSDVNLRAKRFRSQSYRLAMPAPMLAFDNRSAIIPGAYNGRQRRFRGAEGAIC